MDTQTNNLARLECRKRAQGYEFKARFCITISLNRFRSLYNNLGDKFIKQKRFIWFLGEIAEFFSLICYLEPL